MAEQQQQSQEALGKCSNCGQLLPESKLDLHEAYCRRNRVKCDKCNEFIDKTEVEAHNNSLHKKVTCKYCQKDMEISQQESHTAQCPERPILCQYCEVQVPYSTYEKHVYQCGSKTQFCFKCQCNIQKKDFDTHVLTCNGKPESSKQEPKAQQKSSSSQSNQQKPQTYSQHQKEVEEQIQLASKLHQQFQNKDIDAMLMNNNPGKKETNVQSKPIQSKSSYPEKKHTVAQPNTHHSTYTSKQKNGQDPIKPNYQDKPVVSSMNKHLIQNKMPSNQIQPDQKKPGSIQVPNQPKQNYTTDSSHQNKLQTQKSGQQDQHNPLKVSQEKQNKPKEQGNDNQFSPEYEKMLLDMQNGNEQPLNDFLDDKMLNELQQNQKKAEANQNKPETNQHENQVNQQQFMNQMLGLTDMTASFRMDSDPRIQQALLASINQQNEDYNNSKKSNVPGQKNNGNSNNPNKANYGKPSYQVQQKSGHIEQKNDIQGKKENIPQKSNQIIDKYPNIQEKQQPNKYSNQQNIQVNNEIDDNPEIQQALYESTQQMYQQKKW